MTPDDRAQAVLALIAAQLELSIAQQALKRAAIAKCRQTARNVLRGRDHRISTLVEVADGAGLDVSIVFTKRSA